MTAPTKMQIPGFGGDVIAPDRDEYDDARAVWNGIVDRRPRLIARCSDTADAGAAVRFARDCELDIAVRGGGHNVAGTAVCEQHAPQCRRLRLDAAHLGCRMRRADGTEPKESDRVAHRTYEADEDGVVDVVVAPDRPLCAP